MLHERADFADLLTIVGDNTGAGAPLVEKDYWVTEALRAVAASFNGGTVFKGGTSLSKAWNVIQRFSEDIDLLVRTEGDGLDSGNARDRYMKEIRDAVAEVDGLTVKPGNERSRSERGISRTSVYSYEARAAALAGLEPTIILEMGIRGGPHPTSPRPIQSMLAAALAETTIGDPTLTSFEIIALDPTRTLVEKLFAIHCACELWHEGRVTALRRQGRHLHDIYFLLGDGDVAPFVGSDVYHELIPEIDAVGRQYFERDHRSPPGMRFTEARALSPDAELATAIQADYDSSQFLFYGERPDLDAIYERISSFRSRL